MRRFLKMHVTWRRRRVSLLPTSDKINLCYLNWRILRAKKHKEVPVVCHFCITSWAERSIRQQIVSSRTGWHEISCCPNRKRSHKSHQEMLLTAYQYVVHNQLLLHRLCTRPNDLNQPTLYSETKINELCRCCCCYWWWSHLPAGSKFIADELK